MMFLFDQSLVWGWTLLFAIIGFLFGFILNIPGIGNVFIDWKGKILKKIFLALAVSIVMVVLAMFLSTFYVLLGATTLLDPSQDPIGFKNLIEASPFVAYIISFFMSLFLTWVIIHNVHVDYQEHKRRLSIVQ